jgi:hypothetical protein
MKRFSFTVLGDGNIYEVKIPTINTRIDGEYNFYGKLFPTDNGVISTISINMKDIAPNLYFGKIVPFDSNNIDAFLIQPAHVGDFNLKFWDVKFHY